MIDREFLIILLAGAGLLIVLIVTLGLLHRRSARQSPRIRYSVAIPTWSALYLEALWSFPGSVESLRLGHGTRF
jgi:hypothetical protein